MAEILARNRRQLWWLRTLAILWFCIFSS